MNQFNIKKTNIVGLCAAVLAVLFSFVPFYQVVPSGMLKTYASSSLESKTYSLIKYNFFGALLLLVLVAIIVLFILEALGKATPVISTVATGLCLASFVLILLTIIVGNSDVKEAKEYIESYSGTTASWLGIDMSEFVKFKVGVGMIFEIILTLVLAASYWINELVIKPMVYKMPANPNLNPFADMVNSNRGYGAANAQYNPNLQGGQPQQFGAQPGQPQQFSAQPGQPQQFNTQPGNQPQQFSAQPGNQPQQFNTQLGSQPQQPNTQANQQTFGGFNQNNTQQ